MDAARIDAARHGDRSARSELLRELQDVWFRLCLSLLGSSDHAREATQETAMRFLRDLHKFRGDSQLQTWSLGIALNVAREMQRRNKAIDASRLAAGHRPALGPDEAAEQIEQTQLLHTLLSDLPDRQRESLVLRFFQDLSVEQTATTMNCAPGTVKATVHQALRALRRKLEQLV